MVSKDNQLVASITATEKPINKIFCEDFLFEIPTYQRPYSWKKEQATQLLDDISYFAYRDDDLYEIPPYFLGSIVLIKKQTSAFSKVVDGQQRLTTLTILLAALRHVIEDNDLKGELSEYIYQKGKKTKGSEDTFRLKLREKDNDYFKSLIQKETGLQNIDLEEEITDPQKRIRENAVELVNMLSSVSQDKLEKLAVYITQRCFMVIVATTEEESAFRIFNVLNDRGMQLSHADILKSEILEKIKKDEQELYTGKWEDAEEFLGIDNFKELFSHIRAIFAKKKAEKSILTEIRTYAKPTENPKSFIKDVIEPYAEIYSNILNQNYASTTYAEKINNKLKWLSRIENTDWIPSVLVYFSKYKSNSELLYRFINQLDILTIGMEILGYGINGRVERFSRIVERIEDGSDIFTPGSDIYFTADEKTTIKNNLLSNHLYGKRYLKVLLMKIDENLSSGSAEYDHEVISIEHVLPQNPDVNSSWVRLFNEEERKELTNSIGNLLLLTRKKNSSARNYDFELKKSKYFFVNGVSPFPLTTTVMNFTEWTPDVIRMRTKEMSEIAEKILDI